MDLKPNNDVERAIARKCREIQNMLISKNRSYGNSVLDPVRCFSKASPVEQILVRIDDKISRMMRGHEFDKEDTGDDLAGYLILLSVAKGVGESEAQTQADRDVETAAFEPNPTPPVLFLTDGGMKFDLMSAGTQLSTWRREWTGAVITIAKEDGAVLRANCGVSATYEEFSQFFTQADEMRKLAWPCPEAPAEISVTLYDDGDNLPLMNLTAVNDERSRWKSLESDADCAIWKSGRVRWSNDATQADRELTYTDGRLKELRKLAWPND